MEISPVAARPTSLPPRRECRSLSLVFPVFNEVEALPKLRTALERWRPTLPISTEVLLVNDGSEDASWELIEAWAAADPTVRGISFARNFGHQAALLAGMRHASGDAVVLLDADLQDPLEIIPRMLERHVEGYDIVYGRRIARDGESWFKRVSAWAFYRLMQRLVHPRLPADAGDFRLVSRRCVEVVCGLPEPELFLRGLFAWTGLRQTGVDYARPARSAGTTKYSLWRMLRFASNAAFSFSLLPVRFVGLCGLLLAGVSFASGIYGVARWFAGATVPGWTSLMVLIGFVSGVNMVAVSVIGEYIGRVHEAAKRRPRFIVDRAANLAPRDDSSAR